jgi:hypothetical protein
VSAEKRGCLDPLSGAVFTISPAPGGVNGLGASFPPAEQRLAIIMEST